MGISCMRIKSLAPVKRIREGQQGIVKIKTNKQRPARPGQAWREKESRENSFIRAEKGWRFQFSKCENSYVSSFGNRGIVPSQKDTRGSKIHPQCDFSICLFQVSFFSIAPTKEGIDYRTSSLDYLFHMHLSSSLYMYWAHVSLINSFIWLLLEGYVLDLIVTISCA